MGNLKPFSICLIFRLACERTVTKPQSIEIRYIIGPEYIRLQARRVCASFSPEYFQAEAIKGFKSVSVFCCQVSVIMICTIVGNIALILALTCKRSRRIKRVNVFLVNLAVGDLAVAVFTNTTEILFLAFGDWTLGAAACKIIVYMQIVTLASATFLLTAMSMDRYQVSQGIIMQTLWVVLSTWLPSTCRCFVVVVAVVVFGVFPFVKLQNDT